MGDISKYFSRSEFACNCGCGFDTIDVETLKVLEDLREHFARPILITSGCRCADYNKKIGGSNKSQHVYGRAADFMIKGVEPEEIYDYLNQEYPALYGFGLYEGWVHVDTRSKRARWR